MPDELTVAVLMGGESAEAEVSRNSAAQVAQALQLSGHSATLIELDPDCATALAASAPDVVFPALHGPPGEDGTVQGFLEILGLPYVGSTVRGCALAMDKAVSKRIFEDANLPTTAGCLVPADTADIDAAATHATDRFGPSVVVKPLNQGSAIGVTPLPNGGDVAGAIRSALHFGDCLIEPFVMGKEVTVGVLHQDDVLTPHPVIEIRTATDEWYDYENRYTPGQSEHIIPAPFSQDMNERLQEIAVEAHRVLGLRDLSRADFIVTDAGDIILLEVNALPGMTPTSLYPDGAQHLGYDFKALVDLLVRQAASRGARG